MWPSCQIFARFSDTSSVSGFSDTSSVSALNSDTLSENDVK